MYTNFSSTYFFTHYSQRWADTLDALIREHLLEHVMAPKIKEKKETPPEKVMRKKKFCLSDHGVDGNYIEDSDWD